MYNRILLKLSGEALSGDKENGIDDDVMNDLCKKIKSIYDLGIQIGIVVGGGNFWRGKYGKNMVKTSADYMGMLATCMNGIALQDKLEKYGIETQLQTSISMIQIAEPYVTKKAIQYLEDKKIVIFSCGTGNPFFSTDTGAALRACEIGADALLVAKTIDGVYTDDPKINPNAKKLDDITYQQILEKNLKVMDSTAIALCKDNNVPTIVFAMKDPENIIKVIKGEKIGTYIHN